jgi:hypothetical protein
MILNSRLKLKSLIYKILIIYSVTVSTDVQQCMVNLNKA